MENQFTYPVKFSTSHEWVVKKEQEILVGITKWAQQELGEIVYIQLPQLGEKLQAGQEVVVVESTKAASDIYCPVGGIVTAINEEIGKDPTKLMQSLGEQGWLFALSATDEQEYQQLMDWDSYQSMNSY